MSYTSTLNAWFREIREWKDSYVPDADPLQHAAKICEEAGELIACEIRDGHSRGGDPMQEAADVLIATLAYMARVGIDPDEVLKIRMRDLWERPHKIYEDKMPS